MCSVSSARLYILVSMYIIHFEFRASDLFTVVCGIHSGNKLWLVLAITDTFENMSFDCDFARHINKWLPLNSVQSREISFYLVLLN